MKEHQFSTRAFPFGDNFSRSHWQGLARVSCEERENLWTIRSESDHELSQIIYD